MNSLEKKYLDQLKLDPNLVANLSVIGEYKGRQNLYKYQSPDTLAILRNLAVIESTESSNRLEGIIADHKRIQAIVLQNTRPRSRSEQEIAGYRDALALIHESWQALPFTINVIKQLHNTIYKYLPENSGIWKEKENIIIERYLDGTRRIRFRPVSVRDTPYAMDELVMRCQEAISDHRDHLIIIPLTIFDFLCIHPFEDGNGRMARLLTLLLLYHAEYKVGRYISLERIFEETKKSYYETLEISSKNWHEGKHNIIPWLTYFWGTLIRAYKEFEERVGVIQTGRGAKTEQIELAIKRKVGPFAISDIENDCPGISRDMIRYVLRKMRDKGIIRSTGIGRSAKWIKLKEF